MTLSAEAPAGTTEDRRRKPRPRTLPRWLKDASALDAIARSRVLMILSVISGEKPVTEAIREAKISRGTYYQLETRALKAMLCALSPMAKTAPAANPNLAATRIALLMGRIDRLEQQKRRSERLLLLTRKSMPMTVKTGRRGRLPNALLDSTKDGKKLSRDSTIVPGQPDSLLIKAGKSAY